jgi:hypothetical protein
MVLLEFRQRQVLVVGDSTRKCSTAINITSLTEGNHRAEIA